MGTGLGARGPFLENPQAMLCLSGCFRPGVLASRRGAATTWAQAPVTEGAGDSRVRNDADANRETNTESPSDPSEGCGEDGV